MTTICIMQPYVFPYLPFFQLAHAVDVFWVLDDVQFIRRGWMAGNDILLDGRRHPVAFPVSRGRQQDLICDKTLPENFARSLNRTVTTLRHAYRRAPHYGRLAMLLDNLANRRWTHFLDFAMETLRQSFAALGLQTPLHLTSSLKLPCDLRGQDRILALCARAGASDYVNPAGGKMLYDADAFDAQGVRLRFLHGFFCPYRQIRATEFQPSLSILDLIANQDAEECNKQTYNYSLIENR